jgi:prepilin-type N-terminal cleavage/methylation domain-containing protein
VKNLSSASKKNRSSGFSLLELIIVLCILLITSGAIFRVVSLTMARSATEQTKLDMFQEGREFMDQMTRDLRQAGYPNARNYAPTISPILATPVANDLRVAVGIVKIAANELWFEADVDGTGTVSVIHYYLDTSTANNCPCLRRSQLPKANGNPYTAQTTPVYQTEVQGVTNTNIFSAYNSASLQTLPLNFNTDGDDIAGLDTLEAVLSLQALNIDPQTHTKPTTTLVTTVRLNNCSLAASGQQSSCF